MEKILFGLTGWSDHSDIFAKEQIKKNKLEIYAAHFPIVELDSSFYQIWSPDQYVKWLNQTPGNFSFVVKAFQAFTGHDRKIYKRREMKELFSQFKEGINVLKTANKLNSILFQFPPWFDLTKEHISRLQFIRDQFENFPIALEFRNRTWFENHVRQSTLAFMEKERWLHVICDEPQAGVGSIPTVLKVTNSQNTLIRFHGRNVNGWNNNGNKHWRKVRFLYRYSTDELNEWVNHLKQLQQHSEKITILFNNNSGGDAFRNAKQLQQMLGITYHDLNPKQIDMFTEDKF